MTKLSIASVTHCKSQLIVGIAERGFVFLGYHFGPEGLAIAIKTLNNFVERATRLYEQGPGEPCGSTRLGEYVQRWVTWAGAGLGKMADSILVILVADHWIFQIDS
jgi:hypothetical protein